MKTLYRRLVPLSLRQGLWWVRNMFSYARSEPQPTAPILDYQQYWEWRVSQHATAMAHPEVVDLCAQWIPDNACVLDVGCGSGEFLSALQKRKPIRALGIDISAPAIELARARGIDARVVDVARDPIVISERVDIVTLFEVIEHLPNSEELLLKLKTLHCPLIVSVPNTGYLYARVRLLMGRFPRQWVYHPAEHLRFWTLRDFRQMCEYLGFQVKHIEPLKGAASLRARNPGLFAEYLVFVLHPHTTA